MRNPDHGASGRGASPRPLLPWVAGALSIVATLVVMQWTRTRFEQDRVKDADRHNLAITNSIDDHLSRHVDLLRAATALFRSSREVEPVEFERFADGLDFGRRYAGAVTVISARERGESLIADRVAPATATADRPGDDLSRIPELRAAIDAARGRASATMSAPVSIEGPIGHDVFVIQQDQGDHWLVVRVSADRLLGRIALDAQATEDAVALVDITGSPMPVASRTSDEPTDDGTSTRSERTLLGRRWQINVRNPDPSATTSNLVSLAFLLMGLAVSAVVIAALFGLSRSHRRALALANDASESEARRRRLLDLAPVAIAELDPAGRLMHANAAATSLLGSIDERKPTMLDVQILGDDGRRRPMASALADLHGTHLRILTVTGEHDVLAFSAPVSDEPACDQLLVLVDETSRRALEDRLAQAEKMEALGLLASGVAHDFNNLLMPIQGFIELVLLNQSLAPEDRDSLLEAHAAGERAAALVEQLLTTARPDTVPMVGVDPKAWLEVVESLLRSLIQPEIELRIHVTGDVEPPPIIRLDSTRLEQIVVNLVVNARDAMAGAGTIDIELTLEPLGAYLIVRDQGPGMDEATQARIFEPFFTTKARRGGTGLGLATVYSAVAAGGGTIQVDSKLGAGTAFTIWLPTDEHEPVDATDEPERIDETDERGPGDTSDEREPGDTSEGRELDDPGGAVLVDLRRPEPWTILVVDDEEYARQLLRQILDDEHYRLLIAGSAEQAIELVEAEDVWIDLIVTDVVLPGRSGPELAMHLRATNPTLPAVFVSGFVDDAFGPDGTLPNRSWFLAKPFRVDELRDAVRLALSVGAATGTS